MTELLCPKCRVAMDTFERSGVTVEHCPDCGGVFLDRGELERLETAETGGANTSSATAAPGASGQALLGQLLNIARQYKGRRRF